MTTPDDFYGRAQQLSATMASQGIKAFTPDQLQYLQQLVDPNRMEGGNIPIPSVTEKDDAGRERGYDLLSLLLQKRIVLLAGEVNAGMALVACASLMYLDQVHPGVDGKNDIQIIVNSPGGSVIDGMAIYDTIRRMSAPVTTIGIGMQASMGSILLASGDTRMMAPSAKLMIHQISSGTRGQATDIQLSTELSHRLHEELKDVYVRHIGLTHAFWDKVLERDTWLTPEQAVKMGFIHMIAPNAKKAPYEDDALARKFEKAAERESRVPKTVEEILAHLNDGSADEGKWSKIRGEMVATLAQFPQFWTEGKKREMGYVEANDNKPASSKTNKKTQQKNV